jgi:hypothetical protein
MLKYYVSFLFALVILLGSCEKEEVTVSTPIYFPGDQQYGWSMAKKNGLDFESSGLATRHLSMPNDFFAVHLHTFTDWEAWREHIAFGELRYVTGRYTVEQEDADQRNGIPDGSYSTFSDDGDVLEDRYKLEDGRDNWVEITAIDTINGEMTVSGIYNLHFLIEGNKKNPINPDRVNFTEGVFEVKFRQ